MMDDICVEKIEISGTTLASILHRVSSSIADVDGLLFGRISHVANSDLTDDQIDSNNSISSDSPNLVATITSFFCSTSTSTFYNSTGQINLPSLLNIISDRSQTLIGWFSSRRTTSLRPSMRESSFTYSLSSQIQLSFQVHNSPKSYTLPPSIFLLFTTPLPFQDQLMIHTHQYRAYHYRFSSDSFQSKTLNVINIGPAFRSHYANFSPNSPFPLLLPPQINNSSSSSSASSSSSRMLQEEDNNTCDQKMLDLCAEGFDIRRLNALTGSAAANYTSELENLYTKMLAKLNGLATLVDKSSARVLEQENRNMKLRYKLAGLE